MKKLILYSGAVGDFDGAYDWVRSGQEHAPENSVGYHAGEWPGESYTVVEIADEPAEARGLDDDKVPPAEDGAEG